MLAGRPTVMMRLRARPWRMSMMPLRTALLSQSLQQTMRGRRPQRRRWTLLQWQPILRHPLGPPFFLSHGSP